jgi:ketol-acid reductoisomerase
MLTYNREQIKWRREKTMELYSQGHTQQEIATKLHIANGTVSSDLAFLRRQAQENLKHHIHEIIPDLYEQCMTGMKRNLKQTVEIGEASSDPRIKLEARRITNECYKIIMDLATSSGVISEAMKFVNDVHESLKKLDDKVAQAQAPPPTQEPKLNVNQERQTKGVF